MEHDVTDTMKSYWSAVEHFCTPFYSNTMNNDCFFHILRFLQFSDNTKQPDKNDNNNDRLQKIRTPFDQFNDAYARFYNSSEYLAVDEVTVHS
jgi:hypothetical protein